MTPDDVVTYAQQMYNATNDDFFSPAELYKHIWNAQNILARECNAVENTYATTTVADQQEYTFPTTTIGIKAASYDGKDLKPLGFRKFKLLYMQDPTTTGIPSAFAVFDRVLYLGPTPDDALALDLFTFDRPGEVSSTSTLDVPDDYHLGLANYLLWQMALKDKNFEAAASYKNLWDEEKTRCKASMRKRKTAGGFNVVIDEDTLNAGWDPL